MPQRVQSPSSINLYKECPRKYFYRYVMGYEILPSIHMVRGSIVHSVLENFFDSDVTGVDGHNCRERLQKLVFDSLLKEWAAKKPEIDEFDLSEQQRRLYFEETVVMLLGWLKRFCDRLVSSGKPFAEAFKSFSPVVREEQYVSQQHAVQGFIDSIYNIDGEVHIIDYKTSKSPELGEDYYLQLAIYAMLYEEKHGSPPHKVGINFLRHGEKLVNVDRELIEFAKREVALIHKATLSDKIDDYPKNVSSLCRYCDFYKHCFGQQSLREALSK